MAFWVWASLGLWVKLPPKTRILGNRGVFELTPPASLHADGVCVLEYDILTDPSPPPSPYISSLRVFELSRGTIIDFKELMLWAVISNSAVWDLPCIDMCCRGNSCLQLSLYVPHHVLSPTLFHTLKNTYVCSAGAHAHKHKHTHTLSHAWTWHGDRIKE